MINEKSKTVIDYYCLTLNVDSNPHGRHSMAQDEYELLDHRMHSFVFSDEEATQYFCDQISTGKYTICFIEQPWRWGISIDSPVGRRLLSLYNRHIVEKSATYYFGGTDGLSNATGGHINSFIKLTNVNDLDKTYELCEMIIDDYHDDYFFIGCAAAFIMMYMDQVAMAIKVYRKLIAHKKVVGVSNSVCHLQFFQKIVYGDLPMIDDLPLNIASMSIRMDLSRIHFRGIKEVVETFCFRLDMVSICQYIGDLLSCEAPPKHIGFVLANVVRLDNSLYMICSEIIHLLNLAPDSKAPFTCVYRLMAGGNLSPDFTPYSPEPLSDQDKMRINKLLKIFKGTNKHVESNS